MWIVFIIFKMCSNVRNVNIHVEVKQLSNSMWKKLIKMKDPNTVAIYVKNDFVGEIT